MTRTERIRDTKENTAVILVHNSLALRHVRTKWPQVQEPEQNKNSHPKNFYIEVKLSLFPIPFHFWVWKILNTFFWINTLNKKAMGAIALYMCFLVEVFVNSLVTETARYAGRLKIPCGRIPQALRDRLCASITHIKTATGTRRLNNFNPWTVLRLISGSHFIRPRTLLFIKPFIDRGPRSESTLNLSQGPNRFSIRV